MPSLSDLVHDLHKQRVERLKEIWRDHIFVSTTSACVGYTTSLTPPLHRIGHKDKAKVWHSTKAKVWHSTNGLRIHFRTRRYWLHELPSGVSFALSSLAWAPDEPMSGLHALAKCAK